MKKNFLLASIIMIFSWAAQSRYDRGFKWEHQPQDLQSGDEVVGSNEVVESNGIPYRSDPHIEDPDSAEGKRSCFLRVRRSKYVIRRKPNSTGSEKKQGKCGGSLRSNSLKIVSPLGIDVGPVRRRNGTVEQIKWIKISNRACGGTAYVAAEAFRPADFDAYNNGLCGPRATRYSSWRGARPAPAPVAETKTPVRRTARNTSHRFPLDQCLGVRNDSKGQGRYGAPRKGGKTHYACDFSAPVGAELRSPCNGRIAVSRWAGKKAGETIHVQCDNGDVFKMSHLKVRTRLKRGTRVGVGTRVGAVGKTGNAKGRAIKPHVHLVAIINGKNTDPQKLWNCK